MRPKASLSLFAAYLSMFPMMRKTDKNFGYARREGFTVVSLPYAGNDLQFLVLFA